MAYAALVSLAQTIGQILNHDQYPISLPGNQEIVSIRDHAVFLQTFLEEYPERAMSLGGRITEVANKAEDIIEYFMLEKFPSLCGSAKSTVGPSKLKFKRQLRKVAEKMKSTVEEAKEIWDSDTIKDVRRFEDSPAASSSPTLAPTGKNDMVGFDDDLEAILVRLAGTLASSRQILPIVGTGGIGKTTLARNAYDHPLIVRHFDIRAWVSISQDYSLGKILSSLVVSMGFAGEEIELMKANLYKFLKGRRYLIVMDDVWSIRAWDELRPIFPDDDNGSRIMLTTREFDVAAYASSYASFHQMQFMGDEQSWNLLQKKVFIDETCPVELEDVGREIARSCRGLPLSIVIIAELLSTISKTRALWETIAENVTSALVTAEGPYEKMLLLSYTALPHHLKPCLFYMGGFPQDYEISVSELIRLWVADGFVKPHGFRTFEEMAEEYLEDLVKKSLVVVTSRKYNGKIKRCILHDSVRELCLRKVQEEKFLLPVMDYLPSTTLRRYFLPQILKNQRRISVNSYDLDLKETIHNSPIRTIICTPQRGYRSMGSVQNFRLLRVLHVVHKDDNCDWEPGQVFELIHLRYLACNIPFIPAAITKLQNLLTLIIYRSEVCLPVEVWELPKLRHLIALSFHLSPHPEGASFPLENLQTLSLATNFLCSEMILKMIPNLRKLGICYSADKFDEDYFSNLGYLRYLEKLKLEIRRYVPSGRDLCPSLPRLLKKLTLSGCKLPWKDMAIVGSLPLLQVLKLRDLAFQGLQWETTEGEFRSLKYLLIDESDLRYWRTEESFHFPCLEHLVLHKLGELEEIPPEIGEIAALQSVELTNCRASAVISAERLQQVQEEVFGEVRFHVRVKISRENEELQSMASPNFLVEYW